MLKVLKIIRQFFTHITVCFSVLLLIPILLNYEKISFNFNNSFDISSFLYSRFMFILIAFLFGYVLMSVLHVYNIYIFKPEQVAEYWS